MFKQTLLALGAVLSLGLGLLSQPAQAGHADHKVHHVIFQVNDNDAGTMNLVLNNALNVKKHFESAGESVQIEVVAYGPGLHMLREDTSPVKARIQEISAGQSNIGFAACGNTISGMTKKEGKAPPLIDLASIQVVPSGVVQIIHRQDEGWHYIRP